MKTALIAGVYLLALIFTTTDALHKKQVLPQCLNPSSDLTDCITAFSSNHASGLCNEICKSALTEYYTSCAVGVDVDTFNQGYNLFCEHNGGDSSDGGDNDGCLYVDADLQACIDAFTYNDSTAICNDSCRSTLTDYYSDCLPVSVEYLREALDQLCRDGDSGDGGDGGDSDPPSECLSMDGDFQNCVNIISTSSDPTVLCGSCRSILTDYYNTCLPDTADSVRQTFDQLCGDGGDYDRPSECDNIDIVLQECVNSVATGSVPTELCYSCRSILTDYYDTCYPTAANILRQAFDQLCEDGGDSYLPSECTDIDTNSDLQNCIINITISFDLADLCDSCRFTVTDHFSTCYPAAVDSIRQVFNVICRDGRTSGGDIGSDGGDGDYNDESDVGDNGQDGEETNGVGGEGDGNRGSSAATLGVTLFTIMSAVLVAVEN